MNKLVEYLRGARVKMGSNKGGALPSVLIILLIVVILGTTLLHASGSDFSFSIFDIQRSSAYYIAEAGAREGVNALTMVANAKSTAANPSTFFSDIAASPELVQGLEIQDFSLQRGVQPVAKVTIEGLYSGSGLSNTYTITSIGTVGKASQTVSTRVTVTFPDTTGQKNFIDQLFATAGGSQIQSDLIMAHEGIVHIKGDLSNNGFNGGAFAQINKLVVDGNLNFTVDGLTPSIGSGAAGGYVVVYGNATTEEASNINVPLYVQGSLTQHNGNLKEKTYVKGNVTVTGWGNVQNTVEYVGTRSGINANLVKYKKVSHVTIPKPLEYDVALYADDWYAVDYLKVNTAQLMNKGAAQQRIFSSGDFTINNLGAYPANNQYENVVIVSKGNITLKGQGDVDFNGVLIAPNGNIEFDGAKFTGVIIAGGTVKMKPGSDIIMKSITNYFPLLPIPLQMLQGGTAVNNKPSVLVIEGIKSR